MHRRLLVLVFAAATIVANVVLLGKKTRAHLAQCNP